jgi:hypothetical protein
VVPCAVGALPVILLLGVQPGGGETVPWRWRGKQRFFYRTTREGPRVRGVYVGNGPIAQAVAAEIEARKAARLAHREALVSQTQVYERAVAPLQRLDAEADQVLNRAMTAAGYRRHRRGPWQKRKMP